jgi:sugar phosphate isomerase/epimerase
VELGAACVSVLVSDEDKPRRLQRFCEACELANTFGLRLNLEFVAFTALPGLRDAVQLLEAASQPNAGVTLDTLHLVRSHSVAALSKLDPELIGAVQLCDGPMTAPEDQLHEALSERLPPGMGEFPLGDLIAVLPNQLPIGVEAPSNALRDQGWSAADRARRAVAATRDVLAQVYR